MIKISPQEIKRKRHRSERITLDLKRKELSAVKPNVNFDKNHVKPQAPRESRPRLQEAAATKAVRKASDPKVARRAHSAPPVPSPKNVVPEGGPKPVATGQTHAPPRFVPQRVKPKGSEQPVPSSALTGESSSRPSLPCASKKRVEKKSPKTTFPKVPEASKSNKGDDEKTLVKFDPLHRYLSEISKYQLLTREEERDYGIRVMEQGDQYAAYVLVTANLRLVVKIALQFQRMWMQNLLDLVQEGNIGLMQAVQKFDPHRNVKFSYYAAFWIKAYMLKFIMDNCRLVKIGTTQGQRKLFFKLKKEKQHLIDQGFYPHPQLLSARMGVSEREVVEMDQRLDGWDVSLDAPVRHDSNTERIEFLESDAETVEERVARKQLGFLLNKKISAFRKIISPREAHIFEKRFLSEDRVTLQVIGERYGISRERVRQIESSIILKMRAFFKREIPDFETYTKHVAAET